MNGFDGTSGLNTIFYQLIMEGAKIEHVNGYPSNKNKIKYFQKTLIREIVKIGNMKDYPSIKNKANYF
ncbi:MAG: hypothetical protein J6568_07350 [Snodgrassella sp.]|nr:hypothetical protein [Snodgrassella sp.]